MPYKARLGGSAEWFNRLIDEIKTAFITEDFINDKSLSGEFLLGYHCQRAELLKRQNEKEQDGDASDDGSEIVESTKE
jgi:CRISPR-associated protein Csd1